MLNRKEWITVSEAADLLLVSRQRVHYLCAMGELAFRWLGPIRFIARAAIEQRISSGRARNVSSARESLDASEVNNEAA